MATFKICVRKKRNDGFYPVYIRVTHNTKTGYIKTDKLVDHNGLDKGMNVTDPFVLKFCTAKMASYVERLNKVSYSLWQLPELIEYLRKEDEDVSFSDYARQHYKRIFNKGEERNARNYQLALQHLERYAGTKNVMFSMLTSTFVNSWIESMSETHRAKEMYPICMRQVFKAACRELNDYDRGVMRIKTNPWVKVDIPRADRPQQLAITPQDCRAFFSAPIPETMYKQPLPELGRDVAMMVLCLGGINTVDIYNMQKADYYDGILHYQRSKTKRSRADGAYMEMRVPPILMPIVDKYLAEDDDPFLWSFHKRYTSFDSFSANVNIGIKKICKSMGMEKEDWYCAYSFRHTWGTVAQNDCGATMAEVAFGMNHSSHFKVTRGYVKVDFSPAWVLNEKVVELIFFTEKESHRTKHEGPAVFERFSFKSMMKGSAYFRGRLLGEVQDIGFNNVEEVIAKLVGFVPDDIPERCMVQFRIENCDKKQVAVYERMKGVSF